MELARSGIPARGVEIAENTESGRDRRDRIARNGSVGLDVEVDVGIVIAGRV